MFSDFNTREVGYCGRKVPRWKNEELALSKDLEELSKKLDLVLKHLDVHYVSESTTAPRLEKGKYSPGDLLFFPSGFNDVTMGAVIGSGTPKKKRGRPKKK